MAWLRLGAAEDRAHAVARLRDQERRIRAIDRMLAVVQREYDEGAPRVDA